MPKCITGHACTWYYYHTCRTIGHATDTECIVLLTQGSKTKNKDIVVLFFKTIHNTCETLASSCKIIYQNILLIQISGVG